MSKELVAKLRKGSFITGGLMFGNAANLAGAAAPPLMQAATFSVGAPDNTLYEAANLIESLQADLTAANAELAKLKALDGFPDEPTFVRFVEHGPNGKDYCERKDYNKLASYTRKVAEERKFWNDAATGNGHTIISLLARAESAEARLKAAEGELPAPHSLPWADQNGTQVMPASDYEDLHDAAIALHADNAALKGRVEGLEAGIEALPELNPLNYSHDEVQELNDAAIRLWQSIQPAAKLAALTGEEK